MNQRNGSPKAEDALRVGVVGANPRRGWSQSAHIPALMSLEQYKLYGVATRHLGTATETAQAFDVPLAFGDAMELIAHPDIDVVAVTVKVPFHNEMIRAAIENGKHVYSEWPLGLGATQARELADLAEKAEQHGLRHIVGLQGMFTPGCRLVRELVGSGRIGRLLAVSVVASSASSGRRTPTERMYSSDPAHGDTVLTVATAHILSALRVAVGPIRQLSSVIATVNGETTIVETGETVPISAPDQLAMLGVLDSKAVLAISVQGCLAPAAVGFSIRIVGTEGTILVSPVAPGAVHIAEWSVSLALPDGTVQELPLPQRLMGGPDVPPGRPRNVALVYEELAAAITEGRAASPNFATAAGLHHLLESIQTASDDGQSQSVSLWDVA